MNDKVELEKKIKKILTVLKSIENKKETVTDPNEKEKLVRMKSYLIKELRENKENLEKIRDFSQISEGIKVDETKKTKAFRKNSLKEGYSKRIRFGLILFLFPYLLISIGLIFQKHFYAKAAIKDREIETALENFYFIWKFLIAVALIYFIIYIVNAKFVKYKALTTFFVISSLVLGFLSYARIGNSASFIGTFSSGSGMGIIPGLFGIAGMYFLVLNLTYVKKIKVVRIKKKEEENEEK